MPAYPSSRTCINANANANANTNTNTNVLMLILSMSCHLGELGRGPCPAQKDLDGTKIRLVKAI